MKPRDVFKIIVATIGLVIFSYGALFLVDGLLASLGLFESERVTPAFYALRGVIEMALGVFFIKGVPPFVDLAFPLSGQRSTEKRGERAEDRAEPSAAHEPPPAAAVREDSGTLNPKPESEAPADGGGR